jgi:DNA-directed RNA polymerase subunit alpha
MHYSQGLDLITVETDMTKGFQRPKRLICDLETLSPTYGRFHAQPFERGFGTTIGNALRRVLLSSIEGAAITAIKIEGVLHEFTPIPNVTEDATNIIMNLKQIPIRLKVPHDKTIYLETDQSGEVTSGNVTPDPDVEILDPNIHVATIGEGGALKIEMRIKNGRGYIPADENFEEDLPIGYIPLDSVHSPIKRVNYSVEAARLGQTTDYDKLILDVWTNGCIRPQDAIAQAAKIMKDHMFIFINFEEQPEEEEEEVDRDAERMYDNLKRSVEELELSVRSYNCLKNADIKTIGELVQKSEAEMLKTKNFGRKSLNEIKEILSEMGLSFGMKLGEDGRPVPVPKPE